MESLAWYFGIVFVVGLLFCWRKEYRDEIRALAKQNRQYHEEILGLVRQFQAYCQLNRAEKRAVDKRQQANREAWLAKIRRCVREGPPH